ncbi:PhzF family phenazine biosynthesis protein [Modestobacter lapidis]|nr:PhzF family phenazine biosynthesis protein [Modestobacter lapidis]
MASSAADRLSYEVVDVFAPRPFAGNPLAVVFDADFLTTGQCQALAFEFHLSETSFLCAPTDPTADYRVRIFTPFAELPFAGHPSVGAAHTLVRAGRLPAGRLRQECGVGVVDLTVDDGGATLGGGPATVEPGPDPADLATAFGLAVADLAGVPVLVAGCGLPFAHLAVHPDAVDRARPDRAALNRLGVGEGVSVLSWDAASRTVRARVFAADLRWGEDPATGSAALGTGVWLAATGLVAADGTTEYTVHQGEAMGRPSVLACSVTVAAGVATAATVSGRVLPVAVGTIAVPG